MDTTVLLAAVGGIAPLIIAAVTRAGWPATAKRWVAIGVSVTLTALVWALTRYPASMSAIMGELAGVIAAAQVVYTALKPTGLIDWVEERTE